MSVSSLRWRIAGRVALAGPGAVAGSALALLGMPLWLPAGAAGVDHIIMPIILFPAVWAVLFFHAVLDRRLARAALVVLAVAGGNAALLARHFAGAASAVAEEARP